MKCLKKNTHTHITETKQKINDKIKNIKYVKMKQSN